MNGQVSEYLGKYPAEVRQLYMQLRQLLLESVSGEVTETLWARLPSYYAGEKFVRLIPFRDHINLEARAVMAHREELSRYKVTPKGMLQIFVNQQIPGKTLRRIFQETLME